MMMFDPVVTVAINHHLTMVGHFRKLKFSPVLRFVVFGGMSYTLVSVQGSLQSLRSINEVTHFTHYTIAHAHLGVYAFFTMTMFGAIYYVVPRLTGRDWPSAWLIRVHFWTTAIGIAIYWVSLTLGGWLQGVQLNDPSIEFLEIVQDMIPYLISRSVAGVLITIGHIAFAVLMWRVLVRRAGRPGAPAVLDTTAARQGAV
jgi:cytochrome c oxidase cbb3-type subunit 1